MKKNAIFLFLALAGTAFVACVSQETRSRDAETREAAQKKQQRQLENLQKMVVVRISEDAKFCIGLNDSQVLNAPNFSKTIAEIGKARAGTPVLIYVTEEFHKEQKPLLNFAIRECKRAKLGKVYFDIPEILN